MALPLFETDAVGNPETYKFPITWNGSTPATWSASSSDPALVPSIDTSGGTASGQIMLDLSSTGPIAEPGATVTITDSTGGNPPITAAFTVVPNPAAVSVPGSALNVAGATNTSTAGGR